VDPAAARDLYERYVDGFWIDRGLIAGFAEWPGGAMRRPDADSGPVVAGVGSAATALGVGAMIAMADDARLARAAEQLEARRALLSLVLTRDPATSRPSLAGMFDYDPTYLSGFLFGDATLLFSLSWHPWPGDPVGPDDR
jgi:hypothetical protein